ncbi:uncharacterized protein LOC125668196 isoform X2 [Ostrea edulis]|uniref:uncharacterized protein LOC125668196 isoform X2 n=1 Tax=Ostrea edulis TaxID=37623 RepID=UPI0024AF0730|nr:uncharacterized protein LOC125668196 isoform X2 [Ostrea edulis]
MQIRKKSKAHDGGLQEGDVLLRLNGVPVKGKTHEAVMQLVDNAGEKLQIELQRPYGKKTVKDPQRPTNLLQPSDTNVVSSASSNYVIPEGDKTRKIITHQYRENEPGGLKSNTYIKQEFVSSQPYQTVNQAQSQQMPQQVYVDIQDPYRSLKENLSPLPTDFQPKSASSPVPHFRVRNVKDVLSHPPTGKVYPVQSPASEPQPLQENDANIPMFRVSKFQPRMSEHEPHVQFVPEPVVYLEPEPIPQQEEYQPYEADVAEGPPPSAPIHSARNVQNEPMMFPVPRPTFDAVKELVNYRRKDENGDEVDHEYYDVHGHKHLPIFAPPVEIEPEPETEDKNIMDSGYDESMMTPGSGSRPPNLPDLDLTRTYSLESDIPGTPDTGSTATRRKKIFSDSAFYDDPSTNFPTIQEQVGLCKKIAKSLTSAANRRARGAKMFAKRKRKSSKWIHDGERYHGSSSAGDVADLRDLDSELSESEGGNKPLFQFRIPNLANRVNYHDDHKMSLSRDEFERLRLSSNKVDHTSVSPSQCQSLVADLQSPRNRGAKLFQKRAARSERWVIDENNAQKPAPQPRLNEIVSVGSPSKPGLSPWEAAMENPLGYVDKAFDHLDSRPKPRPMSVPQYQPPQYKPVVQAPVVQPVSVPFQQTQTYKKQTNISLRTDEKPKVITGPNYNRLAKGWRLGGDQRDGSTRRAQQQQWVQHQQEQQQWSSQQPQFVRQEPPPPPPPQKPVKQQENYNRKIKAWSSGPGSNTKTVQESSSVTSPVYGGQGQPQGYRTTDSYNYEMTSVTDF